MVCAATAFTSRLIERFDDWSHYANVLWDGTILDAREDWTKAKEGWDCGNGVLVGPDGKVPPGVRLRPAGYLNDVSRWLLLELPTSSVEQYKTWEQAGRSQLGKPYDKLGIIDFVTGQSDKRNWRDQSAWFCDELGAWMGEQAKYWRELPDAVWKQTPGAVLDLAWGAGAKILDAKR